MLMLIFLTKYTACVWPSHPIRYMPCIYEEIKGSLNRDLLCMCCIKRSHMLNECKDVPGWILSHLFQLLSESQYSLVWNMITTLSLAVTSIWILQNYLQMLLCLAVSTIAIHFCQVLQTLTSPNFVFGIDWSMLWQSQLLLLAVFHCFILFIDYH